MSSERAADSFEARSLTRRFGGIAALDGVTMSVPRGQLRCIIGPNGAGKSTFFNLITGLIRPTAGTIWFEGSDITRLPAHIIAQRGVVRSFQTATIFDQVSVIDNIRIATQRMHESLNPLRKPASLPGVHAAAERVLEEIGLTSRAMRDAGTLAHGEKKRLEFGMVLATQPRLLLLDEPTAGMTIGETAEMAALIRQRSRGMTMLVIEHDIDFVREIADYITVLHRGRVFAEGTVRDIETDESVREIYLGGVAI